MPGAAQDSQSKCRALWGLHPAAPSMLHRTFSLSGQSPQRSSLSLSWGSVVQHLPNTHKALASVHSTVKQTGLRRLVSWQVLALRASEPEPDAQSLCESPGSLLGKALD